MRNKLLVTKLRGLIQRGPSPIDFPIDAITDGLNVELTSGKIQSRGGSRSLNTDGLPAGSEIVSLKQIRFPTNEKSFLVAQVQSAPGKWALYALPDLLQD